MRRWLTRLALIAIALALMGQEDACSPETDEPAKDATGNGQPEEKESVTPEPDGEFNLNCDYLLGDFTEGGDSGFKFVAGGTVKNTGNVGIVVRVRVRWQQLGAEPILEERTVRLKPDRRKRVNITRLASSNEIDAHQSADGDCKPAVTIVDTFGAVRE